MVGKNKNEKKNLKEWCLDSGKEHILKEWDYDKNKDIQIDKIGKSSSKEVWWKCKEGHSYKKSIVGRTNVINSKCPYCSNRKLLQGFNDLETWCKNNNRIYLLEEWDYEKNSQMGRYPNTIVYASGRKVYWKCKEGHYFKQSVFNRARLHSKCAICTRKNTIRNKETLEEWCKNNNRQELLEEWDYEKNNALGVYIDKVSRGSNKRVWWNCKNGHSYAQRIYNRTSNNVHCKSCSVVDRAKAIKGINDLETWCKNNNRQDLIDEWDYEKNTELGLYIDQVRRGSTKVAWWKCKEGHSFKYNISYRTSSNAGCRICNPKKSGRKKSYEK